MNMKGYLVKAEPCVDLQSTISITLGLFANVDVLPVIDTIQKAVASFPTKDMNIYLHDFKATYEISYEGNMLLTFFMQMMEDDYEMILGKLVNMAKQHTAIALEMTLWKIITPANLSSSSSKSQPRLTLTKYIWDLSKMEKIKRGSSCIPSAESSLHPLLVHIQQEEEEMCEDGLYEVYEEIFLKLQSTKAMIDEDVEVLEKATKIAYTLEELQQKQTAVQELYGRTSEAFAKYEKKRSLRQFNSSLSSIKNDMDIFFFDYNK
jgi:hypothetical protein